jgi:glycosyltransferase involved in cell wall biosynthesis
MNKKTLNILLLPNEFYPPKRPPITDLFAKEMPRRGHKIFCVLPSREKSNKLRIIHGDQVEYYIFPSKGSDTQLRRILNRGYALQEFYICKRIIETNKIDITHVRDGVVQAVMGIYFDKKYDIPLSFQLTSHFLGFTNEEIKLRKSAKSIFRYIGGIIFEKIYNHIIRRVKLFLPISEKMAEYYKIDGMKRKILPLPVCISDDFLNYENKSRTINGRNNKNIMICIGQILRLRKLEFLIDVLSRIVSNKGYDDLELLLIGPSFERDLIPELKMYAEDLDVQHSVKFIGEVPRDRIPEYISLSKIGLSALPPIDAYRVSTPTKTIEYLSLGIPTVANKEVYDQKEILDKSGGGFAVNYDEEEFANAIMWLLDHPEEAKKMGRKGKEWIKENRTYREIAAKLERRYYDMKGN